MDRTKDSGTSDSGDTDRIIADELEQLLASPLFVRSPVLSRLLQFLAEHRLQGGRSAPKAYAIATEALGRSADFDPAVDSYPRVMVGRLRSLLDRYYADTPWIHRLRVPQGSYEIVVQYRASPPSRPGDRALRRLVDIRRQGTFAWKGAGASAAARSQRPGRRRNARIARDGAGARRQAARRIAPVRACRPAECARARCPGRGSRR